MPTIHAPRLPSALKREVERLLADEDPKLHEAAGFMPYIAKLTAHFDHELLQAYFVEDVISQVRDIAAEDNSDLLIKIKQIIDTTAASTKWSNQGSEPASTMSHQ